MSEIGAFVAALGAEAAPDEASLVRVADACGLSLVRAAEFAALREVPRRALAFRAAAEFDADPDTIDDYEAAARALESACAAAEAESGRG